MTEGIEKYEVIIGLETHIQLNTNTKIFCSCKADSWDDEPNTNICPVCSGLPGVLPVLNQAVVEKAVLLSHAMDADIPPVSFFDRKNYFYPDLPKGYQITQYDLSVGKGGGIDIPLEDGRVRHVRIHKLHVEEDAGKTRNERNRRLIDFNRCGVPLIEMVTEPDLRSPEEAAQYVIRLRQLVRWLGISEGDMEKGHLRADANVSIRPVGADYLNPKTEIKNLNTIDGLRTAVKAEVERQIAEMEAGGKIEQWTLSWDEQKGELKKMRSKETEADYRYFREPDLLPVVMDDVWRESILLDYPELPLERRARFMETYQLPVYDADVLTAERPLSDYFEAAVKAYGGEPKKISNWVMNDVMRMLNEQSLQPGELKLTPAYLAEIQSLLDARTINGTTAKKVMELVMERGQSPRRIVEAEGLGAVSDEGAIRAICERVVAANPAEVENYKNKPTLMGWFVGQVMRESRGKADAKTAQEILTQLLG
ncbi:MAG: Asp-tRNA(Asn)/Glu-tRNA(Gln) amidotransferase subunit GatB [Anaerolineae bacterium]|nr:Asp-tRNA(Asn)/Glu-tRNA(Gln) amidotransferase subunit GatB [Anaerolineae bacterium]